MRVEYVRGENWNSWLEAVPGRFASLEQSLGELRFFGERYDRRYVLTVATWPDASSLVGVAAFCLLEDIKSVCTEDAKKSPTALTTTYELVAIGVDRSMRLGGIGRSLIEKFVRALRLERPHATLIVRNWFTEAEAFYERCNFRLRTVYTRAAESWMLDASPGVFVRKF